jgi:hypothetical protein
MAWSWSWYVPGVHLVHVQLLQFDSPLSLYSPGAQILRQESLAWFTLCVLRPRGHWKQNVWFDSDWYFPISQSVHWLISEDDAYFPGRHSVQIGPPSRPAEPGKHAAMHSKMDVELLFAVFGLSGGQSLQTDMPFHIEYVPNSQSKQAEAPIREYVPALHMLQGEYSLLSMVDAVPAVQLKQGCKPSTEYEPALQTVRWVWTKEEYPLAHTLTGSCGVAAATSPEKSAGSMRPGKFEFTFPTLMSTNSWPYKLLPNDHKEPSEVITKVCSSPQLTPVIE